MAHLHQNDSPIYRFITNSDVGNPIFEGRISIFYHFFKNWYNCFVIFENQTRVTILFWIVSGIIYLMSQHKSDCFIKSTIFLVSDISGDSVFHDFPRKKQNKSDKKIFTKRNLTKSLNWLLKIKILFLPLWNNWGLTKI